MKTELDWIPKGDVWNTYPGAAELKSQESGYNSSSSNNSNNNNKPKTKIKDKQN